jgi:hypothetical protein
MQIYLSAIIGMNRLLSHCHGLKDAAPPFSVTANVIDEILPPSTFPAFHCDFYVVACATSGHSFHWLYWLYSPKVNCLLFYGAAIADSADEACCVDGANASNEAYWVLPMKPMGWIRCSWWSHWSWEKMQPRVDGYFEANGYNEANGDNEAHGDNEAYGDNKANCV